MPTKHSFRNNFAQALRNHSSVFILDIFKNILLIIDMAISIPIYISASLISSTTITSDTDT